jgi:hypothetical protein
LLLLAVVASYFKHYNVNCCYLSLCMCGCLFIKYFCRMRTYDSDVFWLLVLAHSLISTVPPTIQLYILQILYFQIACKQHQQTKYLSALPSALRCFSIVSSWDLSWLKRVGSPFLAASKKGLKSIITKLPALHFPQNFQSLNRGWSNATFIHLQM